MCAWGYHMTTDGLNVRWALGLGLNGSSLLVLCVYSISSCEWLGGHKYIVDLSLTFSNEGKVLGIIN